MTKLIKSISGYGSIDCDLLIEAEKNKILGDRGSPVRTVNTNAGKTWSR